MSANQGAAVIESLELDLLLEAVFRAYGVDARRCPRPVVEHTAGEMVRRAGVASLSALLDRTLHDRDYGERAAAALTCCHFSLFADADFFYAFRERVVPWLRTHPFTSIWVAQCGTGGDAYSIAIMLEEAGLYDKTRVYATDESPAKLAKAVAGVAAKGCLRYSDENYRLAGGAHSLLDYFDERDGAMAVNAAIRRNIVWAEYGLATGQSFNEFNLIVCRNIVRSLTPTLQRRAYKLFTESLPIFGLLALGIDEMPNISPYIYCYKEWDREAGLHQRVC